jgi:hypothetical protein
MQSHPQTQPTPNSILPKAQRLNVGRRTCGCGLPAGQTTQYTFLSFRPRIQCVSDALRALADENNGTCTRPRPPGQDDLQPMELQGRSPDTDAGVARSSQSGFREQEPHPRAAKVRAAG